MSVLMKMAGLALVLFSVISGIASLGDIPKSGDPGPLGGIGLAVTAVLVAYGIWQIWLRFLRAGRNDH